MGFKEIDADSLNKMLSEKQNFILVDVRTPAETNRGIIPGAKLMPLTIVPIHYHELPKDVPVIVYCQSGARSAQASMFIAQHGYENIYNLVGGISTWIGKRLPVDFPNT